MRCLVALLMSGGLLAQSVTLTELPELARARAERQRVEQEEALKPFWADLSLQYNDGNREILDECIPKVAELADAVVPLLLEKLTPSDDSDANRFLADNCARVLELLDPASFSETLVELANGESHVARRHAITLLGYTRSGQAVELLRKLLPEFKSDEDQRRAIESLTRLKAEHVAEQRTIKLVVELRQQGVSFRGIVAELKRRRRRNRAGRPFMLAQVQRILKRG